MQKVILCGNPNTGKTTLFNTLTKSFEKASNWHGVTVKEKEKIFKINGEEFLFCDLPGIYSLNGISKEEEVAKEYILKNKDDAIVVCVLDANNLKRNLLLALELKEICPKLIFAVNMANEVKCLDCEKLTSNLKVKTVLVDARKKKSVQKLSTEIYNKYKNEVKEFNLKNEVFNIFVDKLNDFENVVKNKFEYIDEILKKSGYDKISAYGQSRIDKVLLNPIIAPILFVLVMGFVFFITFGFVGENVSKLFVGFSEGVCDGVVLLIKKVIKNQVLLNVIEEGAIKGVLSVIGFLPQILLMSFCLNLLEDFGYLSRVAFMFDGFLKKLGLTGRALFSLIMGLGCTTSAVITTRNLNGENLRERTVMLLPFMSCSAKLPIYAVICSAFFNKHKALIVFSLYLLAFLLLILVSFIKKQISNETNEVFIMEMPKIRIPTLKKVWIDAFSVCKSFISKVGFAILISSIIIYLLGGFTFSLNLAKNINESILGQLADKITFIFKPLGFGLTGVVVALISGFIAKEMVVSSLAIINGCGVVSLAESLTNSNSVVHFSSASAISFLVFVLLYSPCISALICVKKELGFKVMFKSCLMQLVVAYIVSFITYLSFMLVYKGLWWCSVLLLIFIAIVLFFVLKLIKKKVKKTDFKKQCLSCKGEFCGNC